MKLLLLPALALLLMSACRSNTPAPAPSGSPAPAGSGAPTPAPPGSPFESDLAFLRKHQATIVLTDARHGGQVALVPAWQGRVMTSTAGGERGSSFGWVNRALIASGQVAPQINAFGGEDRFWLGPEGGQFALFFAKGSKFEFGHWQTPAPLDTQPFEVVEQSSERAVCARRFQLVNYAGTSFDLEVTREVRLRDPAQVLAALRSELDPAVRAVSFETVNTVRNAGAYAWREDTGLISIWILGMFNASPDTTVIVPFEGGPDSKLGPVVRDDYFGKVPAERLRIDEARSVLYFSGDAQLRSKIGVGPLRAKKVLGSWDEARSVLTLVEFSLPREPQRYVNSLWRMQDDPYGGDVVNSYNDGPATEGGQGLGNFYELETSSPALALKPGDQATHVHRTTHLEGPKEVLARVAKQVLGIDLHQLGTR